MSVTRPEALRHNPDGLAIGNEFVVSSSSAISADGAYLYAALNSSRIAVLPVSSQFGVYVLAGQEQWSDQELDVTDSPTKFIAVPDDNEMTLANAGGCGWEGL